MYELWVSNDPRLGSLRLYFYITIGARSRVGSGRNIQLNSDGLISFSKYSVVMNNLLTAQLPNVSLVRSALVYHRFTATLCFTSNPARKSVASFSILLTAYAVLSVYGA